MYFGTEADVTEKLKAARIVALQQRKETNRARRCSACEPVVREESPYSTIMNQEGIQFIDALPGAPIGTFCGFKVNGFECKAIDYIFHTAQWTSSEYKVIDDSDGKYYPSDHLPVTTTLKIKK